MLKYIKWIINSELANIMTIVSFATGIFLGFLGWLTYVRMKRRNFNSTTDDMSYELMAGSKVILRKKIKKYLPVLLHDYKSNTSVKLRNIVRVLKRNKQEEERVWFIVGDGGMGKTSLLEYLALSCMDRDRKDAELLSHRGIVYLKFVGLRSLKELDEMIESKTENLPQILILDAFDEFVEIVNRDIKEVYDDFVKVISRHFKHFKRIVITSRKDVFVNGIEMVYDANFENGGLSSRTRILEIEPFSKWMMIRLHLRIGGTNSSGDISSTKLNIKRGKVVNAVKLLSYCKQLSNDSKNIFSIPLFLNYTDFVFDNFSLNELNAMDKSHFIQDLVTKWIEVEFTTLAKEKGVLESSSEYLVMRNRFEKSTYRIQDEITKRYLENDRRSMYGVSTHDIKLIISNENSDFSSHNHLIRNFMIPIDKEHYQFLHSYILEFFISKYMISSNFEEKIRLMNDARYPDVKDIYARLIYHEKSNIIDKIIDSISAFKANERCEEKTIDRRNISEEKVRLLLDAEWIALKNNTEISIINISKILPLVKVFKTEDIDLYHEDVVSVITTGKLDLSRKGYNSIEGIRQVGSIQDLNLLNNNIINYEPLTQIELDKLYIDLMRKEDAKIILDNDNIGEFNVTLTYDYSLYNIVLRKNDEGKDIKVSQVVPYSVMIECERKGELNQVIDFFKLVCEVEQRNNTDSIDMIRKIVRIGTLESDLTNDGVALDYLNKGVDLCTDKKDVILLAKALFYKGISENRCKRYKVADNCYDEVLKIYGNDKEHVGIKGKTLYLKAKNLYDSGSFDLPEVLLPNAIRLMEKDNKLYPLSIAFANGYLARVLYKKQMYPEVERQSIIASKLFAEQGDYTGDKEYTLRSLKLKKLYAVSLYYQGKYKESQESFQELYDFLLESCLFGANHSFTKEINIELKESFINKRLPINLYKKTFGNILLFNPSLN